MNVSAQNLAKDIGKYFKKLLYDDERRSNYLKTVYEKFNMPTGEIQGYIGGQFVLNNATPLKLYMMTYGIDEIFNTKLVKKSFTQSEIDYFSKEKIKSNKIKFPIVIKCFQVSNEQWIGVCTAQFLMQLRESQLINYNKNAQRVMKKVIRNGNYHFKIDLNESSVNAIKESFESNVYIPDVITLNMPEYETDYIYNEEKSELIIKSISMFDMADGFHRYSALCRLYDADNTFDYPMELQILNYPDDKVRQFIFQQDQKNRMRKIDSDSMNMNNPVNKVIERLNSDSKFYLSGCISRNEGKINYAELAQCVDYFFYRNGNPNYKSKEYGLNFIINTEPIIRNKLNDVIQNNQELIKSNIDFRALMIIFYCITKYEIEDACNHIKNGLANIDKLDNNVFSSKKPRKGMLKYIEQII